MTATLPTPQSRPPVPQRATNPFRHPRKAPSAGPQGMMQFGGAMKPPGGYQQPMMTRPTQMPGSPCGPMSGYMNNEGMGGMPGQPMSQPNIARHCVPIENLTPYQRQRRESNLASLHKIHQMLLANDGNSSTDFSHLDMSLDGQAPISQPPNSYNSFAMSPSMAGAGQPMCGPGVPMSPVAPGAMESKPPPPYPAPSPAPAAPAPTKKASRKRKTSVAPSPTSSLDAPPVKTEKQYVPPSPLAAPTAGGGTVHPQGFPPGQFPGPKPPAHVVAPKVEDGPPGQSKCMMSQQSLARQQSMPNLPPQGQGAPTSASYRMLQAGQPIPYQVCLFILYSTWRL